MDESAILEEKYERQLSDFKIISRLLKFVAPYKHYIFICLLLVCVSVPVTMGINVSLGKIVDVLKAEEGLRPQFFIIDMSATDAIIYNLLYVFFALIVNAVCTFFLFRTLGKTGELINWNMRKTLFAHIESFSNNQFNSIPVGKLVTRVTSDVQNISDMYANVIVNLFRNVFSVIMALVFMLLVSVKLTLFTLLILPFLIIGTIFFRRISRKAYRLVRTGNTEVNTFLSEHLSGVKITQMFAREHNEFEKFRKKTSSLRSAHFKSMISFAIFRPFVSLLHFSIISVVIYVATGDILLGVFSMGALMSFYSLIDRFTDPLSSLSEQFDVLQNAFASAEKIFSILDTKPDIVNQEDLVPLTEFKGEIEFKDVWFAYKDGEWVLKGISFKINPKDTIAFIGATGAGKTTILSLITRNYDVTKGEIYIDGIEIKRYRIEDLRKNVGQMLQDVFMFSGTIKSNITLSEASFSDDEVKTAAKYVNASHFIERLPNSYDSEVLERGNNFSAGQKQLISFARTLLFKPSIIILDEATANIDTETEQLIQDSLNKMMSISTMIIVAHRLSTIQKATRIYVLDKGEIIEQGNHQELLKLQGRYYQLYLLQYTSSKVD